MIRVKHLAATLALSLCVAAAMAQEKKSEPVFSDIKFSGYIMTQYQASFQDDNESNSFNLRLVRAAVEGRALKDFYWKLQVQLNGNTSTLGNSPRLVDAFGEWQKYSFFKVKVGQFKRPFTFENPCHPIDQGFMSYSQNVTKLSGFSDRVGEQACNGRDMGVQIQGDFLKNDAGRNLLHYQIGVFNGQGINTKDVDERKDIIGGVWFMPVKGMRIGFFGWTGTYARKGTWTTTDAAGVETSHSGVRTVDRKRYAISGEYISNDWTFRSEYIHSHGYGFAKTYQSTSNASDCTINTADGNEADGLYALCIAPVIKNKFHVKARYDMYRPRAEWNTSKTQYELGADYIFAKKLKLSAEYILVNDRSLEKENYSMVDVQLSIRF